MKRLLLLCTVLSALLSGVCFAQQSPLLSKLDYILISLQDESITVQKEMADFFIESCEDPQIRDSVAVHLYNHYINSPLMGVEAVAVHIFDNWYATGKTKFAVDEDFFLARLYCESNRRTLLGETAPVIELFTPEGELVEVPGPEPRFKVVFFYDVDCSKCRLFTMMLDKILLEDDPDVEIDAIYTGSDPEGWADFRSRHFALAPNHRASVRHFWDPDSQSGFALSWGVLQTPALFLVSDDSKILGRRLTPAALEEILGLPLTRLSPLGERLPDLEAEGQMCSRRFGSVHRKHMVKNLKKLKNTILMFYSPDCNSCREELESIPSYLAAHPREKIFLVEADVRYVHDFDLSILPMLLKIDRKGRVSEKYISIFRP